MKQELLLIYERNSSRFPSKVHRPATQECTASLCEQSVISLLLSIIYSDEHTGREGEGKGRDLEERREGKLQLGCRVNKLIN